MAEPRDAVRLSWPTLIALAVLGGSALSAGWLLMQQQLTALDQKHSAAIEAEAKNTQNIFRAMADKENLRHVDEEKRIDDLHQQLLTILNSFDKRRDEFLNQDEFKQFSLRFDALTRRVEIIEATRPTSGELATQSRAVEERLTRIENQIRNMENSSARPPPVR